MQIRQASTSWDESAVRHIIASHQTMAGALLPMLHALQDSIGFIPADSVPLIALALNLSRAEVHGVITYYHHFRQTPPGHHVLQICRAEACQARGSEALATHAVRTLGCDFHETTADGAVSLEPAYCLGHCAVGPNIAIGDEFFARITPARLDALLQAKRGAA